MPRMDLQSGVIALVLLAVAFAFIAILSGLRAIRSARKMTFYRLRRQRETTGWRLLGLGVFLLAMAVVMPLYGLPMAYEYFPPSPTPVLTRTITPVPSITLTPTITLSPTITDTPLVSDTPTASPTPYIPVALMAQFTSIVTPDPDVVFSPLLFTTAGASYPAVAPSTAFQNPVGHLYAVFSYDHMLPGVQWTALWLRDRQFVFSESKPWDGGTGGSGATDWNPSPDKWTPGIYDVQIFVGQRFIISGRFIVQGDAPTPPPTATPSRTSTPLRLPSPSNSPTPAVTPTSAATSTP
jgi:hypothetical protein